MLEVMTARMPTVGCDLQRLADLTDGMSGADLKAVCQQAALHALVRARGAGLTEGTEAIHQADFERAVEDRRVSEAANRG
jgi:transitional endoplasmic reticulum ATPase